MTTTAGLARAIGAACGISATGGREPPGVTGAPGVRGWVRGRDEATAGIPTVTRVAERGPAALSRDGQRPRPAGAAASARARRRSSADRPRPTYGHLPPDAGHAHGGGRA